MKTVWHWKNIGIAAAIILSVGVLWGFVAHLLALPGELPMVGGLAVGCGTMLVVMAWLPLYHFTYTE